MPRHMISFQEEMDSNSTGVSKYVRKADHSLALPGLDNVRVYLRRPQFRVAEQPRQAVDIHTPGKLYHCAAVARTVESDMLCDSGPHGPTGDFCIMPSRIFQPFEHAL